MIITDSLNTEERSDFVYNHPHRNIFQPANIFYKTLGRIRKVKNRGILEL